MLVFIRCSWNDLINLLLLDSDCGCKSNGFKLVLCDDQSIGVGLLLLLLVLTGCIWLMFVILVRRSFSLKVMVRLGLFDWVLIESSSLVVTVSLFKQFKQFRIKSRNGPLWQNRLTAFWANSTVCLTCARTIETKCDCVDWRNSLLGPRTCHVSDISWCQIERSDRVTNSPFFYFQHATNY